MTRDTHNAIIQQTQAHVALARSEYHAGESGVSFAVQECMKQNPLKARIRSDNVAGVSIPIFTRGEVRQSQDGAGMGKGGEQIREAREQWQKTLSNLVTVGSLQTQFIVLDAAIKVTNRRVNALDKVQPLDCQDSNCNHPTHRLSSRRC